MAALDNQALFTLIHIEGFSKNNPQIIDQYFATDLVAHQFGFALMQQLTAQPAQPPPDGAPASGRQRSDRTESIAARKEQ